MIYFKLVRTHSTFPREDGMSDNQCPQCCNSLDSKGVCRTLGCRPTTPPPPYISQPPSNPVPSKPCRHCKHPIPFNPETRKCPNCGKTISVSGEFSVDLHERLATLTPASSPSDRRRSGPRRIPLAEDAPLMLEEEAPPTRRDRLG